MATNKVIYGGETLIDLTNDSVDAEHLAKGYTAHDKAGAIITGMMQAGGGLPSGIQAMKYGSHSLASASNATSTIFTINHGLGVVPDLFVLWAVSKINTKNSYLWVSRMPTSYNSTTYYNYAGYHGNSTSTVTVSNYAQTSVLVTDTNNVQIKSASSSYYWRASTYRWVAIKFV